MRKPKTSRPALRRDRRVAARQAATAEVSVAAPVSPEPAAAPKPTKLATIVELLQRPTGASMAELIAATGWQTHSVRGAVSGHLRGKLGLKVVLAKDAAGSVYRIESPAA